MKIEVKVPSVGESIVSGILTKWIKKNNDTVMEGDPLFELETDKVNVEVPSPAAGKIEIISAELDEVKIGQIVAYIDNEISSAENKEPRETPGAPEINQKKSASTLKTSPSVRRIAGENNINLEDIKGSGKSGRITAGDITENLEKRAPEPPSESHEQNKRQTVVKMTQIRKTIAKRLVQAKTDSAYVTTFNLLNMEHVASIRAKYKEEIMEKHGIKLGIMSFFVKAACQALKEYPDINSMIRENDIVYNNYYNIGIAVAVDEGLIVPVIKDADSMTFIQIESKINELAQKARDKKITLDDLQGGTFSITNGGVFGSLFSTPIPNFPEPAILGLHAIKDSPYAVDGRVEIKPVMYAALTYDHRIIDGKTAVEFLVSIKNYIEDPESLLIEL